MTRRTLALAALAAAIALPVHIASAQLPAHFGIGAGATLPSGDYADATKTGYHVLATLDIRAPLMPLGLRIDGMFNELDIENSSEKSRVWVGTANAVYNMGVGGVGPYVIGGLGLYHNAVSGGGVDSETKFGLNGGIGVRIPLTGFSAFAEARYHRLLDTDGSVALVPLSFGITF